MDSFIILKSTVHAPFRHRPKTRNARTDVRLL